MTSSDRFNLYKSLIRETLATMTPSGTKFSGQQIAYAKGAAGRKMRQMGL